MTRPSTRNPLKSRLGYDEMVRKATGLIVAGLHHTGSTEAEIRQKVNAAVKEALEGDKEFVRPVDFDRGQPDLALSTAGIFRIVLAEHNIDRNDLRAQETFADAVRKAVEAAITDAVFGIDTAGG
jgi:hypothetical protein